MLTDFKNEIEQVQLEVSERLIQDSQTIKDNTEKIKEMKEVPEDEMRIKFGCSHYYHMQFDADLLMEAAKRANWKLSEPYNSFVLALGEERMNLDSALDVSVDFLFTLWEESIFFRQKEFLTLGLLTGLTYGRDNPNVLKQLAKQIQERSIIYYTESKLYS